MRIAVLLVACLFALAGCKNSGNLSSWAQVGQQVAQASGYGQEADAAVAVKDTLSTSTNIATTIMGKSGSYNIPLPQQLQSLDSTLGALGYGDVLGNLKEKMNAAASSAAAEAAPVFKQAITNMTVTDALGLLNGGDTAVTHYFETSTRQQLVGKMNPIVESKLQSTGFNSQYQTFLNIYQQLPMANKPDLSIKHYVVDKTLDGLYNKMAQQEVAIRQDPAKAASDLVSQFLGDGQAK